MHGKTLAFMTAALFVATVPQAALASPLIGGALAAEKVSPVENATTTATAGYGGYYGRGYYGGYGGYGRGYYGYGRGYYGYGRGYYGGYRYY